MSILDSNTSSSVTGRHFTPALVARSPVRARVLSPCIASLDDISGCELQASSASPHGRHASTPALTMTTTMMLPAGGIALVGAQTGDIGDRPPPVQAMQVEMTQDIVDELLESMRSGNPPQILFGRTPVRVPLFFFSKHAVSLCVCVSANAGWCW